MKVIAEFLGITMEELIKANDELKNQVLTLRKLLK